MQRGYSIRDGDPRWARWSANFNCRKPRACVMPLASSRSTCRRHAARIRRAEMRVFERAFGDRYVAFRSNNARDIPTVCLTDYSLSLHLRRQRAPRACARADVSIDRRIRLSFVTAFARDSFAKIEMNIIHRDRRERDLFFFALCAFYRLPFAHARADTRPREMSISLNLRTCRKKVQLYLSAIGSAVERGSLRIASFPKFILRISFL